MSPKLQKDLRRRFPDYLRKNKPAIHPYDKYDMECGDGWWWLIDQLLNSIQLRMKYAMYTIEPIKVVQVKEKFGQLNFRYMGGDDIIRNYVTFAEILSNKICEDCGTTKDVMQNSTGCIKTLCTECRKKKGSD